MTSSAAAALQATVQQVALKTLPPIGPSSLSKAVTSNNKTKNHFQQIAQRGWGKIVATASSSSSSSVENNGSSSSRSSTKLTTLSHASPVRWVPLRASSVARAGAAMVYQGNYGGGLLSGDAYRYDVHVQRDARLGLLTQGVCRIYKQATSTILSTAEKISSTHLEATVDKGACLVVAPDPVTPFAGSAYKQEQSFWLHPQASLCAVDWFAAGRYTNGERWQQDVLSTRTNLYIDPNNNNNNIRSDANEQEQEEQPPPRPLPVLVDALTLNGSHASVGMDWSHFTVNAYATVLLYGSQMQQVQHRFQRLQTLLAAQHTATRTTTNHDDGDDNDDDHDGELLESLPDQLAGRVLLGVSKVSVPGTDHPTQQQQQPPSFLEDVHVARLAANSNEDLYRVLHACLQPLAPSFGFAFYRDRVRAGKTAPSSSSSSSSLVSTPSLPKTTLPLSAAKNKVEAETKTTPTKLSSLAATSSSSSLWPAMMLADSALPTGSFAHSAGLEAAAQLQVLSSSPTSEATSGAANNTNNDLVTYVDTAVRSYLQQCLPALWASHQEAIKAMTMSIRETGGDDVATANNLARASWSDADRRLHAMLVSNGAACRASVDQGKSLLRVALQWAQQDGGHHVGGDKVDEVSAAARVATLRVMQDALSQNQNGTVAAGGHLPTVLGAVAAVWGLSPPEAATLLGYGTARDVVSAAVRLNLVGPLASVALLSQSRRAVDQVILQALQEQERKPQQALPWPGGCAPILDALHPCHDVLAVRLFRT